MIKIGKTITESGIIDLSNLKKRTTVRAVILNDNNIYMLYSTYYNDYTLPGGGLKSGEDIYTALKRELKEELGANKVKIIKDIGYTEEIRYGLSGNDSVYHQTSYYVLCHISDIGSRTLNKRELTEQSKPVFVDIDKAIKHNKEVLKESKHQEKGFKTVLERENMVLNHIKENFLK